MSNEETLKKTESYILLDEVSVPLFSFDHMDSLTTFNEFDRHLICFSPSLGCYSILIEEKSGNIDKNDLELDTQKYWFIPRNVSMINQLVKTGNNLNINNLGRGHVFIIDKSKIPQTTYNEIKSRVKYNEIENLLNIMYFYYPISIQRSILEDIEESFSLLIDNNEEFDEFSTKALKRLYYKSKLFSDILVLHNNSTEENMLLEDAKKLLETNNELGNNDIIVNDTYEFDDIDDIYITIGTGVNCPENSNESVNTYNCETLVKKILKDVLENITTTNSLSNKKIKLNLITTKESEINGKKFGEYIQKIIKEGSRPYFSKINENQISIINYNNIDFKNNNDTFNKKINSKSILIISQFVKKAIPKLIDNFVSINAWIFCTDRICVINESRMINFPNGGHPFDIKDNLVLVKKPLFTKSNSLQIGNDIHEGK